MNNSYLKRLRKRVMKFFNLTKNLTKRLAITWLVFSGVSESAAISEVFSQCATSRLEKKVMVDASRFPLSVSFIPNYRSEITLSNINDVLNRMDVDMTSFNSLFRAAATVSANNCQYKYQQIVGTLLTRYQYLQATRFELKGVHKLLRLGNIIKKNHKQIDRSITALRRLKAKMK